jgi:hypothetical protein
MQLQSWMYHLLVCHQWRRVGHTTAPLSISLFFDDEIQSTVSSSSSSQRSEGNKWITSIVKWLRLFYGIRQLSIRTSNEYSRIQIKDVLFNGCRQMQSLHTLELFIRYYSSTSDIVNRLSLIFPRLQCLRWDVRVTDDVDHCEQRLMSGEAMLASVTDVSSSSSSTIPSLSLSWNGKRNGGASSSSNSVRVNNYEYGLCPSDLHSTKAGSDAQCVLRPCSKGTKCKKMMCWYCSTRTDIPSCMRCQQANHMECRIPVKCGYCFTIISSCGNPNCHTCSLVQNSCTHSIIVHELGVCGNVVGLSVHSVSFQCANHVFASVIHAGGSIPSISHSLGCISLID